MVPEGSLFDVPHGSWSAMGLSRTFRCNVYADDSISHKNARWKGNLTMIWRAPDKFDFTGNLVVRYVNYKMPKLLECGVLL